MHVYKHQKVQCGIYTSKCPFCVNLFAPSHTLNYYMWWLNAVLFLPQLNDNSRIVYNMTTLTENRCPYIAPDQCTNSIIPTCCERIQEEEDDREVEDGGVISRATLMLLLALSLLATITEWHIDKTLSDACTNKISDIVLLINHEWSKPT